MNKTYNRPDCKILEISSQRMIMTSPDNDLKVASTPNGGVEGASAGSKLLNIVHDSDTDW